MAKPDRSALSSGTTRKPATSGIRPQAGIAHRPYRWRDVYVEREEIRQLLDMWKKVADVERREDIEPQLAILIADSGFGKTRLVHKFYEAITARHQRIDSARYWPPKIGRNNDALAVSPPFSQVNLEKTMPFLWWGIQLPDQTGGKTTCTPVLADAVKLLAAHMLPMEVSRKLRDARQRIGQELANFALVTIQKLTLIETAKDYYEIGEGLFSAVREILAAKKKERATRTEQAQEEAVNLVDEVIDNLSLLLDTRTKNAFRIPMVLFIDDAQWMYCESTNGQRPNAVVGDLLLRLMTMAKQEHWPLMIVLTHWERDWKKLDVMNEGIPHQLRIGAERMLPEVYARVENPNYHGWDEWRKGIIRIGQFDLSKILKAALPGVFDSECQRRRLIGRIVNGVQLDDCIADNARYLDEFLKMIYQNANREFFVGRNIDNPFIDGWEGKLSTRLGGLEYKRLVQNRFDNLDDESRDTLCWSSYQGIEFPEMLTEAVSLHFNRGCVACPWTDLENPEALLQRHVKDVGRVSRFPDSVCRNVAYDAMSSEMRERLEILLRKMLSYWLFYGEFDEGLGVVSPSDSEEELLCRVAMKVFDGWQEDYVDSAIAIALSRLARLSRERHDYQTAYDYARRLVEILPADWSFDELSYGDVDAVLSSLIIFSRADLAEGLARSRMELCSKASNLDVSQSAQWRLFDSYIGLGDILFMLQRPDEAQHWFMEAYGLTRRHQDMDDDTLFQDVDGASYVALDRQWVEACSMVLNRLGSMAMRTEELDKARKFIVQSTELQLQLVQGVWAYPLEVQNLIVSYLQLSDIDSATGDSASANRWLEMALEFTSPAYERSGDPRLKFDLARIYLRLGKVALSDHEAESATRWLNQSYECASQLREETPGPEIDRAISEIAISLGQAWLELDDPESAMFWFGESYNICSRHVKNYAAIADQLRLAASCQLLGLAALSQNNTVEARRWLTESLAIYEKTYREQPLPHIVLAFAQSSHRLAKAALSENDQDAAWAWYKNYLAHVDRYQRVGQMALNAGKPLEAIEILRNAVELNEEFESVMPAVRQDMLIMNYGWLAHALIEANKHADARLWLEKLVEIAAPMINGSVSTDIIRNLAVAYELLAEIAEKEGNSEDATSWLEKATETRNYLH